MFPRLLSGGVGIIGSGSSENDRVQNSNGYGGLDGEAEEIQDAEGDKHRGNRAPERRGIRNRRAFDPNRRPGDQEASDHSPRENANTLLWLHGLPFPGHRRAPRSPEARSDPV